MPRYVVAFDLDTAAMAADLMDVQGLSRSKFESARTRIYQTDVPRALAACGHVHWKQGSLYYLDSDANMDDFVDSLRSAAKEIAPDFCRYLRSAAVYPLAGGRDVTTLLTERPTATGAPR